MTRTIVTWRDKSGRETARDVFTTHGRIVVQTFILDQQRRDPELRHSVREEPTHG